MMEKRIFQVLIVDDEPYIMKTISALLEEKSLRELEIFQADSAFSALATMVKRRIDILITDIQMPFTTGLQLAHEVRARWPDCKIILLTAYADFHFARCALQEDVFGYVLKSDPDSRLLEEFSKAIGAIEAEAYRLERLASLQNVTIQQVQFLIQQTICVLLEGVYADSPANYQAALRSLGCSHPEEPIALACFALPESSFSDAQCAHLQYLCEHHLPSMSPFHVYARMDGRLYTMLQSQQEALDAMCDTLSIVVESFYSLSQQNVGCLVCPEIRDNRELSDARGRICKYPLAQSASPFVHTFYCSMPSLPYASQIMAKLREYIDENLFGDVTLGTLANLMGYNASYLSRLFLRETGENLSCYIANRKIGRICAYIRGGAFSLDEIAEMAGFDNRSYFNRFVKRMTGLSPKRLLKQYHPNSDSSDGDSTDTAQEHPPI